MEPIFKDINETRELINPIVFRGESLTAVTINKLIFRPVLQRVVFTTTELDRVIVYEGTEYAVHTGDTDASLITDLLNKINTTYSGGTH